MEIKAHCCFVVVVCQVEFHGQRFRSFKGEMQNNTAAATAVLCP